MTTEVVSHVGKGSHMTVSSDFSREGLRKARRAFQKIK